MVLNDNAYKEVAPDVPYLVRVIVSGDSILSFEEHTKTRLY